MKQAREPGRVAGVRAPSPSDFSAGFLLGLLVGEGHFGGDGRQPQVTLRMHVRHEKVFRWLERVFPEGRLYGPYDHGGRRYYQWMARGAFLRDVLVPLVREHLAGLDGHATARFRAMCARYGLGAGSGSAEPGPGQGRGRRSPRRR